MVSNIDPSAIATDPDVLDDWDTKGTPIVEITTMNPNTAISESELEHIGETYALQPPVLVLPDGEFPILTAAFTTPATEGKLDNLPWPKWQVPPEVTTAIGSARVVENRIEFILFDDPVGYAINIGGQGARFNPRVEKYQEYKEYVQDVLAEIFTRYGVGVPAATQERPVRITTAAFFRHGTHPDPENVHKGIKDAIFWRPKSERKGTKGDKYTGGTYEPPMYDPQNPRVHVEISW